MEKCASCAIESDSTEKETTKEVLFKVKSIQLSCVDIKRNFLFI